MTAASGVDPPWVPDTYYLNNNRYMYFLFIPERFKFDCY